MKAEEILLWSQVSGYAVEFEFDGKIYQITGREGMAGYWERFFHEKSHSTRRKVGKKEIQKATSKAKTFRIYKIWKDQVQDLTALELKNKICKLFEENEEGI